MSIIVAASVEADLPAHPDLPAAPESLPTPERLPTPEPPSPHVRSARLRDAPDLYALSRAFVPSGALRARSIGHYLAHAGEFLVAEGAGGDRVRGCLALRDEAPATAVLYNFCVAPDCQGQGVGSELLRAAVERARRSEVRTLFTATTGSARLFLRHGFVPVEPGEAPADWAAALDPARGSRVLRLTV